MEKLHTVSKSKIWSKDHKLLLAQFRRKMKKVGKNTRPFRYDLNQIPYDYTVEVMNRVALGPASPLVGRVQPSPSLLRLLQARAPKDQASPPPSPHLSRDPRGHSDTLKRDRPSILHFPVAPSPGVTALQQLAPTRECAPGKLPLPQEASVMEE